MLHLDDDTFFEQLDEPREHYIPLHTTDVVEYLALDPKLAAGEESQFRQVSSLILALLHHLYRQRHEQLTYIYAPLDPDRDRLLRSVPTSQHQDELVNELSELMQDSLHRANYHRLAPQDIQTALKAASHWGVRMRVRFSMLSKLEVYARGLLHGRRKIRHWRNCYRLRSVEVPVFQRIVVVFRTSPELRSDQFDPRRVYLRMFKNVPRQDVDMLFPATGIQMSWLDHSKIVVPSLYAAGITLWKFIRSVFLLALVGLFKTLALVLLVIFAIGFGLRSLFTYRTHTQRRYLLNMTQNLYYQNLDNNAGVLLRLLEEGEQQEAMEAILAYFIMSVHLKDRVIQDLMMVDEACEALLFEATGFHVDFDVEPTCRRLLQLGILRLNEQGWSAVPFADAIQQLDSTWDNWFERCRQQADLNQQSDGSASPQRWRPS